MESENTVYTKQQRIAELARIHPDVSFTSLAHHIDLVWLYEAFGRTRKDGAPGIDKQTAEEYEKELNANLRSLWNALSRESTLRRRCCGRISRKIRQRMKPVLSVYRRSRIRCFRGPGKWCWSLYMNRNFWTAHMGSGRGVLPTTRCNRCGRR